MLSGDEVLQLLLALGTLLAVSRVLGELARRLRQPVVLGEILAGLLLGPTLLGRLAPAAQSWLFPDSGRVATVLDGLSTLALALFLLVAGLEVDLRAMWRQKRTTLVAGLAGMLLPFVLGLSLAALAPAAVGRTAAEDPRLFVLFFATAMSISALPVIARTLMDLYLYRSDFGMSVVAAAMLNDIVGWLIFAALLGELHAGSAAAPSPGLAAALALGFALIALTVLRWVVHRMLPWIQAHTAWPSGVLGFALVLTLLGAAFTQYAGIHAIFGAFLVGVALGDSRHLRERTRATISDFVASIFSPLFFGTIGLRLDLVEDLEPWVCSVVLVVACCGKLLGCGLGARLSGVSRREAWAFAFAMNARGSMEIVLGLLALEAGLIGQTTFVALLVMAVVTTMLTGPALQLLLERRAPRPWTDHLSPAAFVARLSATTRRGAIEELARALAASEPTLEAGQVTEAVWERERHVGSGLGAGVAAPHVRIEGLARPRIALGISLAGVDFDALDGAPARILLLLATPAGEDAVHLALLGQVGGSLSDPVLRASLLQAETHAEVLAHVRAFAGRLTPPVRGAGVSASAGRQGTPGNGSG